MSRSGTLQDALRSVDAFQRAENPAGRSSARDSRGSDSGDLDKSERKQRKSKEDGRRNDELRSSKGRKSSSRRVKGSSSEQEEESDDELKEKRRSEGKRRHKRDERKREKSSRRGEKKGDKEKGRSRRRKHKSKSSKSERLKDGSSDDDGDSGDSGSQSLENEDASGALRADQVVKEIFQEFPEVANDLKQLLQMVDAGQAVDISALPSKQMISLLQKLFKSLRLDKSKKGIYLLPSGAQPTLKRIGMLLEVKDDSATATDHGYEGPELPSSASQEQEAPRADHETSERGQNGNAEDASVGPAKRRIMGPAMPSADMLEAAAKLAEAEALLRAAEEELEGDPMIGPPPPAAVAEAASANDAERFEEVTRIIAPDVGNAYDILGLKREVTAADLKKRYWKLSLLVHPDKCEHPKAHEAFMALNKAFKDLQDPGKRSVIDRIAEEKQAKEDYEAELKAKREAAQWRKLRGEDALPGDAELLKGDAKEAERDEWMTVLPPERQAGRPSQQSTFFSRSEKTGRGDTSIWTDTPLEKAQKAKMQYLEAYKQAALTGPEPDGSSFEKEKAARAAAMIDQYNERKRAISMVDKIQKDSVKESKKKKKKGAVGGAGEASLLSTHREKKESEWEEKHPWKPWDREKDMTAGRQAVKWDAKSVQEGLGSRFGSNSGERRFL